MFIELPVFTLQCSYLFTHSFSSFVTFYSFLKCDHLIVSCQYLQVRGLSAFAVELDFLVEEYAASKGQFPPRQRRKRQSLYVATIEKANSLVNSLIEHGRINSLGLVVVDEVTCTMLLSTACE